MLTRLDVSLVTDMILTATLFQILIFLKLFKENILAYPRYFAIVSFLLLLLLLQVLFLAVLITFEYIWTVSWVVLLKKNNR